MIKQMVNTITKKVIVIIPRYREKLEDMEAISLKQTQKILGGYDICYLSPEKMRSYYQKTGERVELFSDEYFTNVEAYSLLLLSTEFYERFLDYSYMLICQLDAFVFYDKLKDFYSMGYDYIGAPLPYWVGWPYSVNRVGNGGLSLRNVRACYNVVKNYMSYIANKEPFLMSKLLTGEYGEDCYFIYCGWSKDIDFATAPSKIAIKFALQADFNHVFDSLSETNLPFGCHAWNRPYVADIWKPYIERHGYNLSFETHKVNNRKDSLHHTKPMEAYGMVIHLINEMIRLDVREARQRVLQVWPEPKQIVIWGNGAVGHRAVKLLLYLDKIIKFIIDKDPCSQNKDGFAVVLPSREVIKKCKCQIVIASINYADKISDQLSEMGLVLNKDYFCFSDLEKMTALEISAVMYKGRLHDWLYHKIMK